MLDREEYIKFKEYALANKLSAIDVRNTTKQQAADIVGIDLNAELWSGGNEGFFINFRENIAREIEIAKFDADFGPVEAVIKKLFPQAAFSADKRHRVFTVYLNGLEVDS